MSAKLVQLIVYLRPLYQHSYERSAILGANLNPVMVSGLEQGGQLMTTTDVDNWPGDHDGLQGPDLMERMKDHALRFNTEIINDHITSVDFSKRPFTLQGGDTTYTADAVIISTR